jgi:ribose 5-phosphate isomerase RpiB
LDAFLNSGFEGGRHERRVTKIKSLEDWDEICFTN